MAGYIGSKASVVSSGAERKKVFAITTTTTSLTGLSYTPTKVHVYHNGIRLVDGTDYTATNGTSITLTNAAESGDEVVVVSYATFQVADAYTQAEADTEFVQVTGDTMTGDLSFGDNDKAVFGSGSDLQIYHSGAQSVIADVGTGQLTLSTNGTDIRLADSSGNRMLIAKPSSEVELYHNGSPKLATTNAGVDVTGTITSDGLTVDGAGRVTMPYQPSFKVAANYSSPPYMNGAALLYTVVEYDVGNNFANSRFTAPVAGVYHFDVSVFVSTVSSGSGYSYIALTKNGSITLPQAHTDYNNITSYHMLSISKTMQLAANDYVQVYVFNHISHRVYNSSIYNHFSGHLIG